MCPRGLLSNKLDKPYFSVYNTPCKSPVVGIFIFQGVKMNLGLSFFIQSISTGVGLAMDAFSVSLTDGLSEPKMRQKKMLTVAGLFALFQAVMPLAGWFCVHTLVNYFKAFEPFIPWIALVLLAYIGGKMLYEGIKCEGEECKLVRLGFSALMIQGIATSIDALSVGLTISDHNFTEALICATVIAAVTFVICYAGIIIGKKIGTAISGKAQIFGGTILILIGIWIFLKGTLLKGII